MKPGARIRGLEDVRGVLLEMGPREAKNLLRTVIFDIAQQAVKISREIGPERSGKLNRATNAKRQRGDRNTLRATVRVNRIAFYWRFLEYGDGPDGVEHAMFLKTLQRIKPDAEKMYLETMVRKLEQRLARAAKRARR